MSTTTTQGLGTTRAAGRADAAAERPNVSRPPHLYARNPYRD